MNQFLHVSVDGDDRSAGTSEHPVSTLHGARDRLRQWRAAGKLDGIGAKVIVHGGDYILRESFDLGPEDSGSSPNNPIVYLSAPGETVRLLGGEIVSGWKPVSDPAMFNRLAEHVRDKILAIDLRAFGVTLPAPLQSRGFSRGNPPSHCELFYNGQPMTLARWPHSPEWCRIAVDMPDAEHPDGFGNRFRKLEDGFFYDAHRPDHWAKSEDIWVQGYWLYNWANSYERVAELDIARKFIRTDPPHGHYGFSPGQKFCFVNVLEELDVAGEYYIDRDSARLYFYPPSPVEQSEAVVSVLAAPMIHLNNASNVTFSGTGFVVECTRGHGIKISGGSHCRIAGLTIRNIGSYGIWIEGGSNHSVQSCDISQTGDGGVRLIGGDRATLSPAHHFVDNCHFHHQARWSRCYQPCTFVSGVGCRITRNLMHDHPHCPILFTGNDHLIEGNEVHSACYETGDVGGIYMGRDFTERGNVIRRNYLHHLGGIGLGSFAIYLDDCASGTVVTENIFCKTQLAIFLGGGRDTVIDNNLIVDSPFGIRLDGRGTSPEKPWRDMIAGTMRKRLAAMNPLKPPYSIRYPELAKVHEYFSIGSDVPGENIRLSNNLCIGGTWLHLEMGAKPEWVTETNNIHGVDVTFINPDQPEKAGFAMERIDGGYRLIAFEKIGLYIDKFRERLPHE